MANMPSKAGWKRGKTNPPAPSPAKATPSLAAVSISDRGSVRVRTTSIPKRAAIFAAIRARRVYGTTNARLRLVFTLNGALMGTDLGPTGPKEIHIEAAGEQPLKAVDVIRDGALFRRYRPDAPTFVTDLETEEPGAFWYVRATQIDNHIAWSSPVWTG